MYRASSYNMYIKQQEAQNSVIRLYSPLDALHVSDYISPSSGATFYEGWNFNFGNTPLAWIQEMLE